MYKKQGQNTISVPFKTPGDLMELKYWFFPKKTSGKYGKLMKNDKRLNAVNKVRAYMTRGAIPHALEMTAMFTEIILNDSQVSETAIDEFELDFPMKNSTPINDMLLRSSYSTAIIKFVNGLLDPLQQGIYAISLHNLANNLNLPSHFVEMRHVCTHEAMPSLEMLRVTSFRALQWLLDNYWLQMENNYCDIDSSEYQSNKQYQHVDIIVSSSISPAEVKTPPIITKSDIKQYEKSLKGIKKFRKDSLSNLNKNLSENQFLEQLIKGNHETICKIFINKNYLMPHGEKCQSLTEKQIFGLRLLWGPFIQSLPNDFLLELWTQLLDIGCSKMIITDIDDDYIDSQLLTSSFKTYPRCELEITICSDWCIWILENTDLINVPKAFETVKRKGPCGLSIRCLQTFETNESSNQLDQIKKLKSTWIRFWIPGSIKIEKKELRDINAVQELPLLKKSKKTPEFVLFKTIQNYKPTPFGCIP